jgi:prepilin-type N-terminal cleavage/methylation domain-containing protein
MIRKRQSRRSRGFSLIEVMIAMVAGSILLFGMGAVLVMIYRGFNESRNLNSHSQDPVRRICPAK